MTKLQFESLHNHTRASDGKQNHLEVLNSAEKYGIGVIAFTDHDILPSKENLKLLKAYSGPVRWLPGIELTSRLPREINKPGTLHILGLFTNPMNKELREYSEHVVASRIERMKHFVKELNAIGFKLSESECIAAADGAPVGNPHVVKALLANPDNVRRMNKMKLEMAKTAESDPEVRFRYERMLEEGEQTYPYVLFMKRSSFYPMAPSKSSESILDLDASVKLIRQSGGVALQAHWFFHQSILSERKLTELIKDTRLDGVETDVKNLITPRDVRKETKFLEDLARRHNALESIGADAHDDRDLEYFANSDAAKLSVGQTQKLIDAFHPSLQWSNIKL